MEDTQYSSFASFSQHLLELNDMKEREYEALNKRKEENVLVQAELEQAHKTYNEWKRKNLDLKYQIAENTKTKLENNDKLVKLKQELAQHEEKQKQLIEDRQQEEDTLKEWKEVFDEQRQAIEQFRKEHKESIEESELWLKCKATNTRRDNLVQQVEALNTTTKDCDSHEKEAKQLADNLTTLSMHHSRLTAQLNTARKEIAKSRQTRQTWEDRYATFCNIAAMAKEDLLSTQVENSHLNTLANEIEHEVAAIGN